MKQSQTIMGIDPGFDRIGWAIGVQSGSAFHLSSYGCIRTQPQQSYLQRLAVLQLELSEILQQSKPTLAGVESLFFANNKKTAIQVAQARGVIISELLRADVTILELTPLQIKSVVTGDGRADKKAMEKMIRLQCALPSEAIIDDTMDAIGIVIALRTSHAITT